jgi:hypothetical protein
MPDEVEKPLEGAALIKEVSRLIRVARARWDAHDNGGCRRERSRALRLYITLTPEQKDEIAQPLRVWLRYRSVKYFAHKKNKPKKRKA